MHTSWAISAAAPTESELISRLAEKIWWQHYRGIISDGQIAYMLERFQSPQAILADITQRGYTYYLARGGDGEPIGYCAARPEGDRVFLSKIYVDNGFRRLGIAGAFLQTLKVDLGAGRREVYLHVNRDNGGSIAAYERLGFCKACTLDGDIGQGYVTEDYEMVMPL